MAQDNGFIRRHFAPAFDAVWGSVERHNPPENEAYLMGPIKDNRESGGICNGRRRGERPLLEPRAERRDGVGLFVRPIHKFDSTEGVSEIQDLQTTRFAAI